MGLKYVVDTHALIWFQEGNSRLGKNARAILSDPASELVIPIIVLAEAVYVIEKGRTKIPSVAEMMSDVVDDARIEIYPLTLEILQQSQLALNVPEMHDRLIVATALHLQNLGCRIGLLTKDPEIVDAALVPTVW